MTLSYKIRTQPAELCENSYRGRMSSRHKSVPVLYICIFYKCLTVFLPFEMSGFITLPSAADPTIGRWIKVLPQTVINLLILWGYLYWRFPPFHFSGFNLPWPLLQSSRGIGTGPKVYQELQADTAPSHQSVADQHGDDSQIVQRWVLRWRMAISILFNNVLVGILRRSSVCESPWPLIEFILVGV